MTRPPDVSAGVSSARCPYCQATLDAAYAKDARLRPKPGDASICFYCAGLLVFDGAGAVRLPTDAELRDLRLQPDVVEARDAVMLDIASRDGR